MKQFINFWITLDRDGQYFIEGGHEEIIVKLPIKGPEATVDEKRRFTNKMIGGE